MLSLIILIVALVTVAVPLKALLGEFYAGWILAVISYTISSNKIRDKFDVYLQREEVSSKVLPIVRKQIFSASIDLTLVIISAVYMSILFVKGAETLIVQQYRLGMLDFPHGEADFRELKVNLYGLIVLATFSIVGGSYGFSRGSHRQVMPAISLLFASFVGYLSSISITTLFNGQFFSYELYKVTLGLKLGPKFLNLPAFYVVTIMVVIAFTLMIAGYVWVWELIGLGSRKLSEKWSRETTPLNPV